MIRKWGLSNFKSFYDKTELELAPLTVLTGTNSSGKSSFIQSMLLIAQTLCNPISSRELVLNGPLVKMGFVGDIKSDENKEINIFFSCNKEESEYDKIGCSLYFDSNEKVNSLEFSLSETDKLKAKRFDGKSNELDIENASGDLKAKLENTEKLSLNHFLPFNFFHSDSYYDFIYNETASHFANSLFDDYIDEDEFPESISESKNMYSSSILGFIKKYLSNIIDINIINKLFSDENYDSYKDDIFKNKTEQANALNTLKKHRESFIQQLSTVYYKWLMSQKEGISPDVISTATRYIGNFFSSSLKYLGPLRFLGHVHPFSLADDPKDVGVSGEYTAFVIDAFKNEQVEYVAPENVATCFDGNFEYSQDTLMAALDSWLNYLEVGEKIILDQEGQAGYKLKVKQVHDNKPRNLTQVGVGISQVLPVLVTCLLAEKGSTLIFEQPELHLHPKVQSRLADFFISMSLLGKQCIVETHSKYFIDILKLRICQSLLMNNKTIEGMTKIYYFDKPGFSTRIIPITMDQYGNYSVWPKGFFDEVQNTNNEILNSINRLKGNIEAGEELLDD